MPVIRKICKRHMELGVQRGYSTLPSHFRRPPHNTHAMLIIETFGQGPGSLKPDTLYAMHTDECVCGLNKT